LSSTTFLIGGGLARQHLKDLTAWGAKGSLKADWAKLADDWRLGHYGKSMNDVRTGKIALDDILEQLQAMSLKEVLVNYPTLKNLTPDRHYSNMVGGGWIGWPDSVKGLTRLKAKYIIGPLSNGSVALSPTWPARQAALGQYFSPASWFKHYKPDPETYLGVVKLMELKPEEVMMGAAHPAT